MNCKKCGKKMICCGFTGYAGKGDATWKEQYIYFCPDCDVKTTGWWIFKKTHIAHHKVTHEIPFSEFGKHKIGRKNENS